MSKSGLGALWRSQGELNPSRVRDRHVFFPMNYGTKLSEGMQPLHQLNVPSRCSAEDSCGRLTSVGIEPTRPSILAELMGLEPTSGSRQLPRIPDAYSSKFLAFYILRAGTPLLGNKGNNQTANPVNETQFQCGGP
jgi:hypothetical protein